MKTPILEAFRRSGDAHLGQTLLRLAALAETAHRFQAARGGDPLREAQAPAQGGDRSGTHTEVRP